MRSKTHRARFVMVSPDLLLQDASVSVSASGTIVGVASGRAADAGRKSEDEEWGSAVIMPGLINAHSHFELTHLKGRLTRFGSFTDWISQLISLRRTWKEEDYRKSAADGIREALCSGTTLAADISTSGLVWDAAVHGKLRCVIFKEVLGFFPNETDQKIAELALHLDQPASSPLLRHGISPHAPYSVSAELYRSAAALAAQRNLPVATHLAETEAEAQFLREGTGEFRDFLASLSAMPEGWTPPRQSPVRYVESLGVMNRPSLLIHCNYLEEEDLSTIARRGCSVVYCPRSHAFFDHEAHPARRLMEAGVNVALGTDSLASNQSLSMVDEIRYLFSERKDLTAAEIFGMATANGAHALGYEGLLGRLEPGFLADMTVFELPGKVEPEHLKEAILEGAGTCIGTVVNGCTAWRKNA